MCSAGPQFSCQTVLDSSAAKLFGIISMADIGLVYFAGSLISLLVALLAVQVDALLPLLALLTLAALPYTLFSVAYQAWVLHVWCPLCLMVQSVLWLEAGALAYLLNPDYAFNFSASGLGLFVFGLGLAILAWSQLKPVLLKLRELEPFNGYYYGLARQPGVFTTVFNSQPIFSHRPSGAELIYGQTEAPVQITLIISTHCAFCAQAFEQARQLLRLFPETVGLCLRIIAPKTSPIATDLLQLCAEGRKAETLPLLELWFELLLKEKDKKGKDVHGRLYQKWQQAHQLKIEPGEQARAIFDWYIRWVANSGLQNTPLFLINERLWPADFYDWKDIRYHIEDLEELQLSTAS